MNWEAIGAVGEILGALGVIITLVYLATQIRQNNRSLLQSNSAQVTERLASLNSRLSTDKEFTELFLRGRADLSKLDAVELERFRTFTMDFLNLAVYQDGLEGKQNLEPLHYDMVKLAGGHYQAFPGIKEIFDSAEHFTPRDLVERFRSMEPIDIIEKSDDD